MKYSKFISSVKVLADSKLRDSGNLEQKLRQFDIEKVIELADKHYEIKEDVDDVFEKGLELGRDADDDTIYKIEIPPFVFYLIGTEAEIIRRIEKLKAEIEAEEKAKEENENEFEAFEEF